MHHQKKPFNLPDVLGQILAWIAEIIEIDYFKELIGRTNAIHLLVYVAGLILCPGDPTMTAIAGFLRVCRHDSLERMLSTVNLPADVLSGLFIRWIKDFRKAPGYLTLDDTTLDKKYSRAIDCAGFALDSRYMKVIMGIHIVVMYWSDGRIKIPVGWRLWMPKKEGRLYKKKTDLAYELIVSNDEFVKSCQYLTFDGWYCCKQILWIARHLGLSCISRLARTRTVVFKKRKLRISEVRDVRCVVEIPKFGSALMLRCVEHGETHYYLSTDVSLSLGEVRRRYNSRWKIEMAFRFMKQELGLESCQCRRKTAVENHINLTLLAHFVMEVLSIRTGLNVYQARKQLRNRIFDIDNDFPDLKRRKTFLKHAA